MKRLLSKEFRLAASPLSYLFIAFALMTLIPGYPILVGAMFVCLGIFYSFQALRENNDILYSVLMPVKKTDVVRAKYAFVCLVQLAAFLVMAALTALRLTALSQVSAYVNNVMMPANPIYLAFVLLIFSAFNVVFLGGFFKTAYGIGWPFLRFVIVTAVLVGLGETLHHIPGLEILKDTGLWALLVQSVFLVLALLVYILTTRGSMKRSMRRFDALDL